MGAKNSTKNLRKDLKPCKDLNTGEDLSSSEDLNSDQGPKDHKSSEDLTAKSTNEDLYFDKDLNFAECLKRSRKDLSSDEVPKPDDDLYSEQDPKPHEDLDFDEDLTSEPEEDLNTIENPNLVEDVSLDKDLDNSLHSDEDVKKPLIQRKRQRAQCKGQLAQCKTQLIQRDTEVTELIQRETELIQRERQLSWQREKQLTQYKREKAHLVKCKSQLTKREAKLAEITKKWKQGRKITINLLRALASEIQKHEKNSRIATLTGSSVSIAGTCIAIGGAIASIFTLGASLIVTFVGVGIAAGGGVTLLGTDLVNMLLRTSNAKLVDEALKRDKEATHEFENEMNETQKILAEIMSSLSRKDLIYESVRIASCIGKPIANGLRTGMLLGRVGGEAGETAFRALGTASKVLHVGGIVFSAITLIVDVYTLVSTSVEVHKGLIVKVVEDIRKEAKKLEDELTVYDEENEKEL